MAHVARRPAPLAQCFLALGRGDTHEDGSPTEDAQAGAFLVAQTFIWITDAVRPKK